MKPRVPSKLLSDIFFTTGAEGILMLLLLLLYRVAAIHFAEEEFAEFMLGRRVMTLSMSVFLLGTSIGVPRFMGMNIADRHQAVKYWLAGVAVVGMFTALGLTIAIIHRKFTAQLIFGTSSRENLIVPLSVFIASVIMHQLIYAYFQGLLKMKYANWLKLLNIGVLPLTGVLLGSSTSEVFFITGLLIGAVSVLVLAGVLLHCIKKLSKIPCPTGKDLRELITYSIGHVPGNLGFAAFFSVPAFIASHMAGITAGGDMSLSLSILYMTVGLLTPVGVVLLPEASRLTHLKHFSTLRKYALTLILITVTGGTLISVVFWLWGDIIFKLYLGKVSPQLYHTCRIVMLGAVPVLVYTGLRAILYALYFLPVNTINIVGGLAVMAGISAVCWYHFESAECVGTAVVAGLCFLAVASVIALIIGVKKGEGNR